LPLVVGSNIAPHQRQLLELLGYAEDRLLMIPPDRLCAFDHLWIPSRLALGGQLIEPLLPAWYRRRLVAIMDRPGSRKLYLTRRGASRRRVTNEVEVAGWFVDRGYEIVAPEELSVRDQIALFAQSSHIAGPTGAAMTNMLFAPPGAKVLAFYNRMFTRGTKDLYFDALAKACGHDVSVVEGTAVEVPQGQRVIDADFRVPLDKLEESANP
jgi:capsular polysaccharide biosynthesis protein